MGTSDEATPSPPAFGAALRRARTERGLSLAALSKLVHYSKGYLSKVENGDRPASVQLATCCDEVLLADGGLVRLLPRPNGSRPNGSRPDGSRPDGSRPDGSRPDGSRPDGSRHCQRPAQLPAAPAYFAGRTAELAWIDEALLTHLVAVITGMPGVGKSALAVRWAEQADALFPDGTLFADLHGYAPLGSRADPGEIIEGFLRALGASATAIPAATQARSALLRTLLHGKRVLMVLDNAATSEQVRPLLPGSGDCRVLVTSRGLLSGLTTREGAARYTLRTLSHHDATTLLRHALGNARVDADPESVDLLVRTCGCLPLALRIVSDRVQAQPRLGLGAVALQLAAASERLDYLAAADDDESVAVRSVISWSYQMLAPGPARMFRLLGLHPGHDIGIPAAAALCDYSTVQARRTLDKLTASSLLDETGSGRYAFHDLIRLYAHECAQEHETGQDRTAASRRLVLWYLHSAAAADRTLAPQHPQPALAPAGERCSPQAFSHYDQALAWFDQENTNLAAIACQAWNMREYQIAWQIPAISWSYLLLRKPWDDWMPAFRSGIRAAARCGDQAGAAWLLTSMSAACFDLGRTERARHYAARALVIRRQLGDRRGECAIMHNLGIIHAKLGRRYEALTWSQRALNLGRKLDNPRAMSAALNHLGATYLEMGEHERALHHLRDALTLCRAADDLYGAGCVLDNLGMAHMACGELSQAVEMLTEALRTRRHIGDRHGEVETLIHVGELQRMRGDREQSRQSWRTALHLCGELGDPRISQLGELLAGEPQARPPIWTA